MIIIVQVSYGVHVCHVSIMPCTHGTSICTSIVPYCTAMQIVALYEYHIPQYHLPRSARTQSEGRDPYWTGRDQHTSAGINHNQLSSALAVPQFDSLSPSRICGTGSL